MDVQQIRQTLGTSPLVKLEHEGRLRTILPDEPIGSLQGAYGNSGQRYFPMTRYPMRAEGLSCEAGAIQS